MAEKRKPKDGKESGKKRTGDSAALSIRLHVPDTLGTQFSNHFVVQRGPHESFLLFFEILPPLLLGSPEEVAEQAKALQSVQATCIARIAVANEFVPKIIKAFEEQIERVKARGAETTETTADNGDGQES